MILSVDEIFKRKPLNRKAIVRGWVKTRRDSKAGFSFLIINDGSTIKDLQIIADKGLSNYTDQILHLTTGCSIEVIGEIVPSPGRGQELELRADEIKVIGWADPEDYPLQKKRHSFEYLRSIAHLRARTSTFEAVFRIRNCVCYSIHRFLQERGFIYIHTPILTGNDCEGAGELFKVTTFELSSVPTIEGRVDYEKDFFKRPAYLTVSGQLEAEAYALALGKVYTFGPAFRAENSNTSRHLAEFWMVEPEIAFCNLEDCITIASDLLFYLMEMVMDECRDEMEFLDKKNKVTIERIKSILEKGVSHITYDEAIDILKKSKRRFTFTPEWGSDIQSEHERYLCDEVFKGLVAVTDYPKDIKPFYMKLNPDGKTVRAMDILAPGVGEIIGGSQREDDYDTLYGQILEKGLNPNDYWWYLELRKYGGVPHSGFGLGLERFLQFITGMGNIRDVIPFPRTPGNINF